MTKTQMLTHFEKLAADARCIDDADYGTDRQINAENFFFGELDVNFPELNDEAFGLWCLKATSDEMIDEAIKRIRAKLS